MRRTKRSVHLTFLKMFGNVWRCQCVAISTTTRLQANVFLGWVPVKILSLHQDSWSQLLGQPEMIVWVWGHLMNLVVCPYRWLVLFKQNTLPIFADQMYLFQGYITHTIGKFGQVSKVNSSYSSAGRWRFHHTSCLYLVMGTIHIWRDDSVRL